MADYFNYKDRMEQNFGLGCQPEVASDPLTSAENGAYAYHTLSVVLDRDEPSEVTMHSRAYLRDSDFAVHGPGTSVRGVEFLQGRWRAEDRVAFVAPDARTGIEGCGGAALMLTHWFYCRAEASQPDFFDYPLHYAIVGEPGARTRHLGPEEERPWSRAWCRLDVWPSIHHVVAEPTAEALLLAVLMVEPQWLFWPASLPVPGPLRTAGGVEDGVLRAILRTRLRGVIVYGEMDDETGDRWSIELSGGAERLLAESLGMLAGGGREWSGRGGGWFWNSPVDHFLATASQWAAGAAGHA